MLFKVKFIVYGQSKQFYFVFNWEGELIVCVSQNCGLVFADVCDHAIVAVPINDLRYPLHVLFVCRVQLGPYPNRITAHHLCMQLILPVLCGKTSH